MCPGVFQVNEAEVERIQSEEEHKQISLVVEESSRRAATFEKELARHIRKSRPYFDFRRDYTRVLEEQKALVQRIEAEIRQKKADYQASLGNLERISEQIHAERQQLGSREAGVGSDSPAPTPPSAEEPLTIQISPEARKTLQWLKSSGSPQSPKIVDKLLEALSPSGERRRSRAKSQPPEEKRISGSGRGSEKSRPTSLAGLHSGVLLLAQQLNQYGILNNEDASRMRAFSFPPEELDMEYRTVPKGVKPFPSPLGSESRLEDLGGILSPPSTPGPDSTPLQTPRNDASERSSLASFEGEEVKLGQMLRSHTCLIEEIEKGAERAKTEIQGEEGERSSASGESCSG